MVWFVQRQRLGGTFQWRDWWRFALLGLVNMPLNQYLFVAGLRYTTAPNAALAFALSPVFVLVLASVFLGERLRWHAIMGIALAVLGAVIVAFQRGASLRSEVTVGNLMELAASCAWAFYTVWGRPLVQRYGAVPTTAFGMLWGLGLFMPVAALVPGGLLPPDAISPRQWGEIAYLGIVTSGVGWALWYVLLRQIEASRLAGVQQPAANLDGDPLMACIWGSAAACVLDRGCNCSCRGSSGATYLMCQSLLPSASKRNTPCD